MYRRHKVIPFNIPLDTSFPKHQIEKPGIPINLAVSESLQDSISTLTFTWDPPVETVPFYKYQYELNGVVFDTVYSYVIIGNAFGNQEYKLRVRAVGFGNVLGDYTSFISYISTGLPKIDATISAHYEAANIMWLDVYDTPNVVLEGYNVYNMTSGNQTKLNQSLLDLNTRNFMVEDLGVQNLVTLGVSYEYNSGQESSIFEVTTVTLGELGRTFKILTTTDSVPIITTNVYGQVGNDEAGIKLDSTVDKDVSVAIESIKINNTLHETYSNGVSTFYPFITYRFQLSDLAASFYNVYPGCPGYDVRTILGDFLYKDTIKTITFTKSRSYPSSFMVTSGCHNANGEPFITVSFIVTIPEGSFIGYKSPMTPEYSIVPYPLDNVRNFSYELLGNSAVMSWLGFASSSIIGYNIYWSDDGNNYTKLNSEPIPSLGAVQHTYTNPDLLAGTYFAYVVAETAYGYETAVGEITLTIEVP